MSIRIFESFFAAMHPATENSDEGFAWFSGFPTPLFNFIGHFSSEQNLDAMLSQGPEGVPLSAWSTCDDDAEKLKARGFTPYAPCPLMERQVEAVELPSHTIRREDGNAFYELLGKGFEMPPELCNSLRKLTEKVTSESYVATSGNDDVSCGTLLINGKVGGIFNMVTLADHQKQKHGRQILQMLMHRAHALGLEKLVLQSTPNAVKFYEHSGFSTAKPIEIYVKN